MKEFQLGILLFASVMFISAFLFNRNIKKRRREIVNFLKERGGKWTDKLIYVEHSLIDEFMLDMINPVTKENIKYDEVARPPQGKLNHIAIVWELTASGDNYRSRRILHLPI